MVSGFLPEDAEINADGHWVTGIPQARPGGIRIRCRKCRAKFWNRQSYRGHYALVHILRLPEGFRGDSGADPERLRMESQGLLPGVPGQGRGRTAWTTD